MINSFKKYKSDKIQHGYVEIYSNYFLKLKDKKLKILEIGVADGKSILSWSNFFKKSLKIGINIKKINLKKKKLNKKNIHIYQGSQSDGKFLNKLIKKYKKFDIIIDDGSHIPEDVKLSFKLLFPALSSGGFYFVEDLQTSYIHFFGGNPFDLTNSNTHVNFFKSLIDRIHFKEIANPYYLKKEYDGEIFSIAFFRNLLVVNKKKNLNESNLVLNNSYENKRFNEKVTRNPNKRFQYFLKYKIFYKSYTHFLFLINLIKKIILFRL